MEQLLPSTYPSSADDTDEVVTSEAIIAGAIFFFLGFIQCAVWATFGQTTDATQLAYHISPSTVTLLLNWGAIIYLPVIPLSSILVTGEDGLR